MTVVFPWSRAAKPEDGAPCTTRTMGASAAPDAAAVLERDLADDLLEDARAIAAAERARVRLVDAIAATRAPIRAWLVTGRQVVGRPLLVGADCLVLEVDAGRHVAMRLSAVVRITGLATALRVESAPRSTGAVHLGSWLRQHEQPARARVEVATVDGWVGIGRLAGVGADHLRLQVADGSCIDVHLPAVCAVTVELTTPPGPR